MNKIASIAVITGLAAASVFAQMSDKDMMSSPQPHQMMGKDMMIHHMSNMMQQMNDMMQQMSGIMEHSTGVMSHERMMDMSGMMSDMSLTLREMSRQMAMGRLNDAKRKWIHERLAAMHQKMEMMTNEETKDNK